MSIECSDMEMCGLLDPRSPAMTLVATKVEIYQNKLIK